MKFFKMLAIVGVVALSVGCSSSSGGAQASSDSVSTKQLSDYADSLEFTDNTDMMLGYSISLSIEGNVATFTYMPVEELTQGQLDAIKANVESEAMYNVTINSLAQTFNSVSDIADIEVVYEFYDYDNNLHFSTDYLLSEENIEKASLSSENDMIQAVLDQLQFEDNTTLWPGFSISLIIEDSTVYYHYYPVDEIGQAEVDLLADFEVDDSFMQSQTDAYKTTFEVAEDLTKVVELYYNLDESLAFEVEYNLK
ncbi:MAG: hypothetical protein BEN19_02005 [Epulopiscium sp. Nuni2H_MBin003]|nr:MAG: hypothetical protein BEN19_02005 [Epulopiscium sp. Nuni2H_MBin003]